MKIETGEIVFKRLIKCNNDRFEWEEFEEVTLEEWMKEKQKEIDELKEKLNKKSNFNGFTTT